MNHDYIAMPGAPKTFLRKSPDLQKLINQTIQLLHSLGLPLDGLSARRMEKMAIAILAIVDVKDPDHWPHAKDLLTPRALQTREIIRFWREEFGEMISDGSYDDVRRKDLILPYLSGMIARMIRRRI